ncbi:MAG: rane protein [Cryptosporangiaceae bacterium]|nr:rane protein [Cryptosporangiaceae bacterium]
METITRPSADPLSAPPVPGYPRRAASRGWAGLRIARDVAVATARQAWNDRILGLSAEAAFWQLLSLPPLLLGVLGLLGYAGGWAGHAMTSRIENHLLHLAGQALQPAMVDEVVRPMLGEVLQHGRGGVATASFVLALWAGSSATSTFVNTTTIAYGQRDLRGALRSRLFALWIYVCVLTVSMVAGPLLILGPGALVRAVPPRWQDEASGVVHAVYWPVMAVILFAALSAFYHVVTPVRLRWRRAVPGAALALVLFLLLCYLLQLYIAAVADRLLVFSTLAAPILALLYFFVFALTVLLGAELNATLERRWPRGPKARPLEAIRSRWVATRPAEGHSS